MMDIKYCASLVDTDPRAAEVCLRSIIEKNPKNADAFNLLGRLYTVAKDYEKAEAALFRSIEIDPRSSTPVFYLGLLYQNAGEHKRAEEIYRGLVLQVPEFYEAHLNLGWLVWNMENGRDSEGEAIVRAAIALRPNDPTGHYFLGQMLMGKEPKHDAIDCFVNAIELSSDHIESYRSLAKLVSAFDKDERCERILEEATRKFPDECFSYDALGEFNLFRGHVEVAIASYEQALIKGSVSARTHANLGLLYNSTDRWTEGEGLMKMAIQLAPDDVEYLAIYITHLLRRNKVEEAEKHCLAALEQNPSFTPAIICQGIVKTHKREWDEAESLLKNLLKQGEENYFVFYSLSIIYYMKDKFDKAEEMLLQAARFKMTAMLYHGFGLIAKVKIQIEEALENFSKAIEMDTLYADPHLSIAEIYLGKNEFELTMQHCLAALEKDRWFADIYALLYKIPAEFNSMRDYDFLRYVYLTNPVEALDSKLDFISETDRQYLIYRFFDPSNWVLFYDYPKFQPIIEKAMASTKPFRQLIDSWMLSGSGRAQPAIVAGIVTYQLGDPIKAYETLRSTWWADPAEMTTMAFYYLLVSANEFLEEDHEICEAALSKAKAARLSSVSNDIDLYYAGLILDNTGHVELAISTLESISSSFIEAKLKLIEIFSISRQHLDARQRLTIEVQVGMSASNGNYVLGIEHVTPRLEINDFLSDIRRVLHFLENFQTIAAIGLIPTEMRPLFSDIVWLDSHHPTNRKTSIKYQYARVWHEFVEKSVDETELSFQVRKYEGQAHRIVPEIANDLRAKVRQEIAQHSHHEPLEPVDFKLYLALNYALLKQRLITHQQSTDLYLYILYCLHRVPAGPNQAVRQHVFEAIADMIIENVVELPGYSHLKSVFTLFNKIGKEVRKQPSLVLSLEDFKASVLTSNP